MDYNTQITQEDSYYYWFAKQVRTKVMEVQ